MLHIHVATLEKCNMLHINVATLWMCDVICMCDVTHMNAPCHTYFECVTSHIHMRDMVHSYVWHECTKSLSHIWMHQVSCHTYECHVTRMNESCNTHATRPTYDLVLPGVLIRHGTRTHESCRTYKSVMLHIWMSHVARINESCRTYTWVILHIWMSHVTCEWVMSRIWTSHVTHMNESCHTASVRCCSVLELIAVVLQCVAVCCSVLQCVAVCCSVLQCVTVCCSVLQCIAVSCSVLQRVAVCCSVLQRVAPVCARPRVVQGMLKRELLKERRTELVMKERMK